jgi:hypothetical protein
MNVMFFLRSIGAEWRISIKGEIAMAQDEVPQCFPSLDEARIYLWGIQHRLAQLFDSFTWEDVLNYLLHRTKIEREFDNAYLEDGENLLTQLLQWRIAFDHILQEVRGNSCDKRFYGALVLHLDYLATYHYATCLPKNGKMRKRDYASPFAEMISLSRSILQNLDMDGGLFTFETRIIKPLYTIACQCPSISLRRQAIALLLSVPRREGFWDAVLCGKVAQWIMSIEEEGSVNDYITEEAKVHNVKVTSDLQRRTARAECLKPQQGLPERFISQRIVINW